jgi:lysozyme
MSKITEQLKRDEGFKLTAYQDHLGYWTIGVGRLIDIRKGGGITAEEAEYLLANDIQRRTKDLSISLPWFDELDEVRKGVLVNMAFQLGTNGLLNFKKTLESVRRGHYVAAANEMLQSKWADQTPMRAERLAKQMMTGVWQ